MFHGKISWRIIILIVNLNAEVLYKCWDKVLEVLTSFGYDVVSNSVDGQSSNRKFYIEILCNGKSRVAIPHPYKDSEWIYLLFDQVHIFKCIYNNFINKKYFVCPNFDGEEVAPDVGHIEELY